MESEQAAQRTESYCAMCWSSCGCITVVKNERLIAVEPNPSHPTGRALCAKGRAAPEYVYSDDRLLYPVKRTRPKGDPDPGWQRISWDEALSTTAKALKLLAKKNGSESVAFNITTAAGTSMQDGYSWVERLRQAFGSPNVVASIELCGFTRDYVYPHTFGVSMPMPDLEHTGCIVLWGHNPSSTWLPHATRVADAKARGAKLVVIDPRRVGFASKADQWLRVRPGSDGALALGIAAVMVDEGLFDRAFVRDWTNGPFLVRQDTGHFLTGADLSGVGKSTDHVAWDKAGGEPVLYDVATGSYERAGADLALTGQFEVAGTHGTIHCRPAFDLCHDLCRRYSPERVEELTWVPAHQVRETARLMDNSGPVSIYTWSGIEQHSNSGQNSRAIALLYALTGSFDAEGGNVLFDLVPVNDVSGAGLMSRNQRQKTLGLDVRPLGPEGINGWITSDALYTAILDQEPYAVKGLASFGLNILMSHSDGARGAKALDALEFMVHADIFMSPTATHADIVLPVNTPWEREGLRTDFTVSQEASSYVQMRSAAVESRGESRSDAWIAFALAEQMGFSKLFWDGDIDAGYREMLAPSGVELENLRENPGGVRVPLQTRYRKYAGTGRNDAPGFNTPSKKVEIYSEVLLRHGYSALPEFVETGMGAVGRPNLVEEFPLILTSVKSPQYLGSQGRAIPALRRIEPDPRVELHPNTAKARGIQNGDWVSLLTPHGQLRLKAHFSANLHPKVVVATHGWWQSNSALSLPGYEAIDGDGANLNAVFANETIDPMSGAAPHKSYACQIVRHGESLKPNPVFKKKPTTKAKQAAANADKPRAR